MKAYSVTIKTWNDFELIYPAKTHGQAKASGYYSARMAGWNYKFTDFRARRAPQFDSLAKEAKGKCPSILGWRDRGETWGCLNEHL